MLSENDVAAVDSFLKDSGIIEILEPWSRIKTALAELGTTPNTGSLQLLDSLHTQLSRLSETVDFSHVAIIRYCLGIVKQLQASA